MRRGLVAVALAALLAAPAGHAADGTAGRTPSERTATRAFLQHPKVDRWLSRYSPSRITAQAEFKPNFNVWSVAVFAGDAGQMAGGKVDLSGNVTEAWVGPEVAWPLARSANLGGKINETRVWLAFCLVFLLALLDFRRPLSLRNLDVAMLLGFSVYLWYFNDGRVFASAIAAAVPMAYLIARCAWIGVTNRTARQPKLLPIWVLVAALVFLVGFRAGLNHYASGVLDVGYAGVIGADRIASGESPYGNFPVKDTGKPCSAPSAEGDIADWIQENGRCETANALGDTYGPVTYHAYLPGLWLFGWTGKWDSLPAVHFTSILFDVVAMLGLAAVGYRYGRGRLAATLALAWAANPFTQYASSSNTNDAIMPALLIWGFWAASSPSARGVLGALAAWTKLASLLTVPLWLTYPERKPRPALTFAAAFAATTLLSFWTLLASGNPLHELRVFYERTFQIQADRSSPFSLWDWGDYHAAGLPDLALVQRAGQVLLVVAAIAVAFVPRRKTPLQLAALTAALLVGFQLLLTHWSGLYVAWFFPFVALAVLAGEPLGGHVAARARVRAPVTTPRAEPRLEAASAALRR
ncbi:MAG TPA: hypothetical protein VK874_01200 [Gaiellaceae bacterium]|nr:hypothetical protein [Gaiellaceae bacterium]